MEGRGSGWSKVELLLGGPLGAAREVKSGGRIFGFHEELLDGAEELRGLVGKASGKKQSKNARVVVAEVDLLSVGELDVEKVAEMCAKFFQREIASNEDTPALGPGLLGEGFDEDGFLRNADQVRREMSQLLSLRALVERLEFFFRFVDHFEDGGLARSVEERVERLEIFGQEVLKARKLGSLRRRRCSRRSIGKNNARSGDGKRWQFAGLERSWRGTIRDRGEIRRWLTRRACG